MVRATKSCKSWVEKSADPRRTEVKIAPKDFADIKAGQSMVLPMPRDIEAVVRKMETGTSLDMRELCSTLAKRYGADIACPVVTGIQLRTLAEAVGEQLDRGISPTDLAPVWRAMSFDAPIWQKLENGKVRLMALRHGEGLNK